MHETMPPVTTPHDLVCTHVLLLHTGGGGGREERRKPSREWSELEWDWLGLEGEWQVHCIAN